MKRVSFTVIDLSALPNPSNGWPAYEVAGPSPFGREWRRLKDTFGAKRLADLSPRVYGVMQLREDGK